MLCQYQAEDHDVHLLFVCRQVAALMFSASQVAHARAFSAFQVACVATQMPVVTYASTQMQMPDESNMNVTPVHILDRPSVTVAYDAGETHGNAQVELH